ncbi:MAG: hypothetical protein JXB32_20340 [Deltaproteobacteria bacterium]|nr:hypothetical protein [Deltaproteobacteria bacterium]
MKLEVRNARRSTWQAGGRCRAALAGILAAACSCSGAGLGCDGGADTVTLVFRVTDARCRVHAHVGANVHEGGTPVPGLPLGFGSPEVTYVYSGRCPSERIYITSEEIGDSVFITDYRFDCRSEPYIVEVYYTSTYCDERIIE